MADTTTTRTGAVRLCLDVPDVWDVWAQQLLWAAGARRFAYNWALARVVANHAQWKAEESYGVGKSDRTRPFSFFELVKQWDATKREQAPWFGEHSTWTFRYAIRAAAGHTPTSCRGRRSSRGSSPGTVTAAGSPSPMDCTSRRAVSGSRSTAGSASLRPVQHRPN